MSSGGAPRAVWLRRLDAVAWAALLALAALLAIQDIRSDDYWWHLRTGRLIVDTGAVTRVDPYTYTVPGARWIDIHWLFQVGLWGLYSVGGHAAVIWGKLLLVCAMLGALAPIGWRPARPWLSIGALAWLLLLAANRFEPRPEIASFALLSGVLFLLDRFERTGDRGVYAIVPLQLLWANLHGLFAVGLAVCAIEWTGELLRPLRSPREPLRVPRVRRLAAVTLLSAATSLANPNGLDGALYPLAQLGMVNSPGQRAGFGAMINELMPALDMLTPLSLCLFLGLAALSLGALAANWRRMRPADLLLWLAFFYLALGAVRNVVLFAIVATPLLVRNLNQALDRRSGRAPAHAWAGIAVTLLVLIAAGDVARGRFKDRIGGYRSIGFGVMEGLNPIAAAEWIARVRPPAPIAHWLGDGDYLIWRLWPDYRVMLDGRLEVFGAEGLQQFEVREPAQFRALDARFHFGSVLLNHRVAFSNLVAWLYASPFWRIAYLDDVSVLFVRDAGEGARIPSLSLDSPGLFASLADVPDPLARQRLLARVRVLLELRRPDLAVQQFEALLARFPDEPRGQETLTAMRKHARGGPPR
jgi:hypothetical protein